MAKKVKGTKIDLATFVGPTTIAHVLPSAPDPNREPSERGGRSGRGGGNRGGFDRDAQSRADPEWSRGNQGGGFDRGGDNKRGSGFNEDAPWQKAGPRGGMGGMDRNDKGGGYNRNGYRSGGRYEEPPMERPAHLKLNLEGRTKPLENQSSDSVVPPAAPFQNRSSAAPVEKNSLDKWNSVLPPKQDVRGLDNDRRGNGNDRRVKGYDSTRRSGDITGRGGDSFGGDNRQDVSGHNNPAILAAKAEAERKAEELKVIKKSFYLFIIGDDIQIQLSLTQSCMR
jgi:hypothetical protein